ncbi:hypothetical protein SAMN05421858_4992 [Haladaptatus litoreus]|uniref:Uncharacterized protein n=1 Tax=Haladaptatus litoreus TaxID=553468 RepID=A0A1N7FE47_9EURY|nr:hypothetical protein SAMN05421858_4992 [Haladaptatus litoreus]
MLRETTLFDALQRELAIVLDETRDDESDAEQLATRMR